MVECCLLHVISVGVCVLFAGFTSTSDVFKVLEVCSPPGKAFHILQKP